MYYGGGWKSIILYYKYFFDFNRLKTFIASFGTHAGFAFVFVQALQVVVAPIPGEVTGFVGGLLFGKLSGTLLSTAGLTLGALTAFGVARIFGSTFVHKVVKKEYIDKFDYFVTHKGLYLTFVLFLIPGFPKDSLCYLLGLTRMRYLDFALMNVFGRLPGTFILCAEGDAVRNGKFTSFWVLFAVSIALVVTLCLTRNYIIQFLVFCKKTMDRKRKK
jgi:uncharacterized membrane protein YdjX (TVP38/TMEM64 family)